MDQTAFDRLARLLGGAATRRAGLRAALGALAGGGAGTLAGTLAATLTEAKNKDNNTDRDTSRKGRGRGRGHDGKDRGKDGREKTPGAEGPCGDGSIDQNRCKKHKDCCTGYCQRKHKGKNGESRCRCKQAGRPCTENRNCCNESCVDGFCGGRPTPPTPAVTIPTGKACVAERDTCAAANATCIPYDRGTKKGTYCLLPFEAQCTADDECVNASCSLGVCVNCSCNGCPSGECVADVCASGCQWSTVQAAIDDPASGDVIHLAPGTYDEDLTISGKNLTLVGCPGGEAVIRNATVGTRAIVVSDASRLELVDIVIEGNNNSMADDGGGIETSGDLTLCRYTKIRNNSGPDTYGGGVRLKSDLGPGGPTLRVLDATAITGNHDSYGGGVAIDLAGQVIVQDNAVIADNSADTYGGGIYLNSAARAIIRGNARVTGNTTGTNGGAIFYWGGGNGTGLTDVPIEVSGNVLFDGNTSDSYGGAIGTGTCDSYGNETLAIGGNAVFSNNKALGATKGGGAIMSYYCRLAVTGNVKFTSNTAALAGGAVYMYSPGDTYGTLLDISGDVEFTSNTADSYGGAMYLYYTKARISGRTVLSGNSAPVEGGAVSMFVSSLSLSDSVRISGNSTDGNGGGISIGRYDHLPVLNIRDNVEISDNTAGEGGGIHIWGLYWDTYAPYIGGDAKITGNSAKVIGTSTGRGGGFYFEYCGLTLGGRAEISGNTAEAEAGGIYVGGNCYLDTETESVRLLGSSVVSGNTGTKGGGVYLNWRPYSGPSAIIGLKVAGQSTITGNTATDATPSGGGVYSDNALNTFSVVSGSITDNTPDQCAGAGATC
ncbi:MAG: hypothetical protein ACKOWF_19610 [Chloroflexota bacterium]